MCFLARAALHVVAWSSVDVGDKLFRYHVTCHVQRGSVKHRVKDDHIYVRWVLAIQHKVIRVQPASWQLIKSIKCGGRGPSGLPLKPAGN